MKKRNDKPLLDGDLDEQVEAFRASGDLAFRSEALPVWCPGCGYFGITHAVNRALNALGIENRKLVVISGIGCAGRYPFFTRCYGFHVVHGRTLPVAAGVKMANPELTVLAIAGDGDGLAIGGGHLPHAIRRNVNVTHILFDNGIYGLTKGQSSPTTPVGQISGTHPYGNPEEPLNPALLALSYGVPFFARGYAGEPRVLAAVLERAISHRGFSMIHVISPCVTFDHVNLRYNRLRKLWKPVPEEHDVSDRQAAMNLAINQPWLHGVLLEAPRPDFEDRARAIAERAAGRGKG